MQRDTDTAPAYRSGEAASITASKGLDYFEGFSAETSGSQGSACTR